MTELEQVVERIFRESYSDHSTTVEEAISTVASDVTGCGKIEAGAYAERKKKAVWRRVLQRVAEEKKKGLFPTLKVVDRARYEFSWFPRIARTDSAELRRKKLRLAYRGEILDYLDEVDWRPYEAIGCFVCQMGGASNWYLTPPGNEFGIDFVAVLPAFGRTHLFPNAHKQIRLVGQSKKWSDKIGREEVDVLASRLADIRRRNDRILGVLPPWFVAAKGSLAGLMIAHSGCEPSGHDFAGDHDITIADRRDIAEVVALSRGWSIDEGIEGALDLLHEGTDAVLG